MNKVEILNGIFHDVAYYLWDHAGRPDNTANCYWFKAKSLVGCQINFDTLREYLGPNVPLGDTFIIDKDGNFSIIKESVKREEFFAVKNIIKRHLEDETKH